MLVCCWHQLRQTRARALAHERCSAHPACWTTTNIVATQKTRRVSQCKSAVRVLHVDVQVAPTIAPNASGHTRQCTTTPITVMDRASLTLRRSSASKPRQPRRRCVKSRTLCPAPSKKTLCSTTVARGVELVLAPRVVVQHGGERFKRLGRSFWRRKKL
jgi:hypothetical protein